MGFRNIMISSNMKLRIQDQQLVVTAGDEVHIPLEDINCILIENQSVTLSAYLLQKVADSGIALYVCDEKHLPNAVLLPMVRHSRHFKILKYQMETGKPLQKRLWQQVVIQKIRNQALCLQLLELEPFRPLVDLDVSSHFDISEIDSTLTPEMKKGLFGIINFDMSVKGDMRIVSNCIDMLIASYSSALQGNRTELDLPELIQLQVHSYE